MIQNASIPITGSVNRITGLLVLRKDAGGYVIQVSNSKAQTSAALYKPGTFPGDGGTWTLSNVNFTQTTTPGTTDFQLDSYDAGSKKVGFTFGGKSYTADLEVTAGFALVFRNVKGASGIAGMSLGAIAAVVGIGYILWKKFGKR